MEEKILKLKTELKNSGISGLALDIDETLSDTNPHWFEHMINFHRPEKLSKEELIQKYRFVEEVPEWQTDEASKYIEQTLHSNEFNETIPLIENADKAVQEINKIIPIVVYITARPATVIEGTLRWLKKHNFPEARLITRPENINLKDFNLNKNRWKAGVLNTLFPEVVGVVDDNFVLAHQLETINYHGTLYLYGREDNQFKNHKNVIVCPTWNSVLDNIKNKL
jgi:5'(3')-deoxyribonucleotidase